MTMTPLLTRYSGPCRSVSPEPNAKPPPCTNTKIGRPVELSVCSPGFGSASQGTWTLAWMHASLMPLWWVCRPLYTTSVCGQTGPSVVALNSSVQGSSGWSSCNEDNSLCNDWNSHSNASLAEIIPNNIMTHVLNWTEIQPLSQISINRRQEVLS